MSTDPCALKWVSCPFCRFIYPMAEPACTNCEAPLPEDDEDEDLREHERLKAECFPGWFDDAREPQEGEP